MNTEQTNIESPADRVHHPYSPSSLQAREGCAKYQPSHTDSEAARTGTMQHDVAESGIDNARLKDFKAAAVVECMKFVDERLRQYPGGKLIKEQYLPIDDEVVQVAGPLVEITPDLEDPEFVIGEQTYINFTGTTAGYLDVGIISADETECEVLDFKFGQVAVEPADNNLQGMAYLLGLRKRFPKIKKGTVWFLMPHRDEISYHTFEADEFGKMHVRIKVIVAKARAAAANPDDFSLATPNASSCLFCALIGKCPKVAEFAIRVGQKYQPLQFPASVSTTVFTDPAEIEKGLRLAQVLKTWAEAYRAQATAKTIDSPDFIPTGYTLVSSQKRAVLKPKALGELTKSFLPVEEWGKVEELYDVSIGNLEALISLHAARGQKEATVKKFGEAALEKSLVELGAPFAFLRQESKPKSKEKQ